MFARTQLGRDPQGDGAEMSEAGGLPPGQFEIEEFPRFGWGKFAFRFPPKTGAAEIAVRGDVDLPLIVRDELRDLPRIDQTSDLHCVTTWSKCGLQWSGFRFRDFYRANVALKAAPQPGADLVVLRAHDGYEQSLPVEDLLAPDVLLADRLDGPIRHSFRRFAGSFVSPSHVTRGEQLTPRDRVGEVARRNKRLQPARRREMLT